MLNKYVNSICINILFLTCNLELPRNPGDTRSEAFRQTSLLRCIIEKQCINEIRNATNVLKISDFTPMSGSVGTIITINGENFSTITNENLVKIGNQALTVLTASSTQLKVKISALPTYGNRNITVSVGGNSASANLNFTYIPTFYFATNGGGLSISRDGGFTYTTLTTANGLGSNIVFDVFAIDEKIYVGTSGGLSVSINGGSSFSNFTTANGLSSNGITSLKSNGLAIYGCMPGFGFAVSTNGINFNNYTTAQGIGSNNIQSVTIDSSKIYVLTDAGISISTNGGSAFTTYTSGLGSLTVNGAISNSGKLYAATTGGLSISIDGGISYTNYTTAIGLGSNNIRNVYVSDSVIYAATSNGLSISSNGGASFSNSNSLPNLVVGSVSGYENYIIGTTTTGIGISRNSGSSYTTYTSAQGLGNTDVYAVFIQ